jgi:myosin-crossreactive antigen
MGSGRDDLQNPEPGRKQMKAHIIGGGFGGLAAAAYLIRHVGMSGQDITIYEAGERMGGGFFLGGSAESGYNLPGSVFDAEFRCTFNLLASIPSSSDPTISVKDEFFSSMRATRSMTVRTSSIATATSCMARISG